MPRFFIDATDIRNGCATLGREDTRHITVLRHKPGDEVILCDGARTDYLCRIRRIDKHIAELDVIDSYPSIGEPDINITLFQGLTKGSKLELIIQKCVELGVCHIVPVATERAIPRQKNDSGAKLERWREISKSAAMQCGRGIVPCVHNVIGMEEAVSQAVMLDRTFVAHEAQGLVPLKEAFSSSRGNNIGIFIGPEGGFSPDEIGLCAEKGVMPVSLGTRVLRTETAGFVAIIIMQYV